MLMAIVDQMPCAEVTAVMKRTITSSVSSGTRSEVDRETTHRIHPNPSRSTECA